MAKTDKPFVLVEKSIEELYESYKKRGYTLDVLEDKHFDEYKKARQAVRRAKNKYPNRLFVVEYRDLMERYNEVLSNLFAFLGIHFDAKSADLDNFFSKTGLPEDVHQDDVGGFGRVPKNKKVEITEEEKERLHRLATLAEEQEDYVDPEERHDSALQDTTTGVTESTEAAPDTQSKRRRVVRKVRSVLSNKTAPLKSTLSSSSSSGTRKRDKVLRFASSAKDKARSAISRRKSKDKKQDDEASTVSAQVASEPIKREDASSKISHGSEAAPDASESDNDGEEAQEPTTSGEEAKKAVQEASNKGEEAKKAVQEAVKNGPSLVVSGYATQALRRETKKRCKDLQVLHVTKAKAKTIHDNLAAGKKPFEGLGDPDVVTGIDNLYRLSKVKANTASQALVNTYPEAKFLVNEKSFSPVTKALLRQVPEDALLADKRGKLASSLSRIRDSIL